MKIGLIVESDKAAKEIVKETKDLLTRAGFKVTVTWPDLEPLVKRVTHIREDIKKIP